MILEVNILLALDQVGCDLGVVGVDAVVEEVDALLVQLVQDFIVLSDYVLHLFQIVIVDQVY